MERNALRAAASLFRFVEKTTSLGSVGTPDLIEAEYSRYDSGTAVIVTLERARLSGKVSENVSLD